MTADQITGMIAPDPSLEGSGALFADMGRKSVGAIVAANGWSAESMAPVQILYRPGRQVLIRTVVWATRHGRSRRFSVTTELTRRPRVAPTPATITDDVPIAIMHEGPRRRSWVFPHDPVLTGLSEVLSVDGACRMAEPMFGGPCSVRSTVVRYRPTRRAVVRFEVRSRGRSDGPPLVLYVKVLPPDAADTIMRLAPTLCGVGDIRVVPIDRPAPDVLLYPNRHGRSMREALIGRTPALVPSPESVLGLLDGLHALPDPGTPGPSATMARLDRSVDLLSAVLPDRGRTLGDLRDSIRSHLERHVVPDEVVHGDFYEGQILIDELGAITGLLDVDDIGLGDPVMDVANYTAHLVALGESHPEVGARLAAHRRTVRSAYLERSGVDARALAAREAVAGLGLATGPFRVLTPGWPARTEKRIALAAHAIGAPLG